MLRATLDVNGRTIDQLEIVRIKGNVGEMCTYRCQYEDKTWTVQHHYDDGAWKLIELAMQGMNCNVPPDDS